MIKAIRRILCVEDHEDTCDILRLTLSDYLVSTEGSCAGALRQVRRRLFDLYVLDNWLPDGTGIELCRQIRRFDPNAPVIFYSAAAYDSDRKAAFEAGAKCYLTKPVESVTLLDMTAQLILQSELESLQAKVAEAEAIKDHISESMERVGENLNRLEKRILKSKARKVFIETGGTQANFGRMWPEVLRDGTTNAFLNEKSNHRKFQ